MLDVFEAEPATSLILTYQVSAHARKDMHGIKWSTILNG